MAQLNYNLFDMELGTQQKQFAYLQAKDLIDTVDGVLHTHDVALWNGNDTSLTAPTTTQYFGAAGQIAAAATPPRLRRRRASWTGSSRRLRRWCPTPTIAVRPTAIYANPVLLDLIDREMKTEFNVVLNSREINGGFTVKTLSTQAGDLPLIPEWALSYTGTPGSGSASLPAYIVTEDLIEYHWLSDADSAHLPAWPAGLAGFAVCGGEVWRPGGEGRELCTCAGDGAAVNHER